MPLVGESGTGTFTQSGGTNQANVLVLAASAGSWGADFWRAGCYVCRRSAPGMAPRRSTSTVVPCKPVTCLPRTCR